MVGAMCPGENGKCANRCTALEAIVLGQSLPLAAHSRLVALKPLVQEKDGTLPLPDGVVSHAQALPMSTRNAGRY